MNEQKEKKRKIHKEKGIKIRKQKLKNYIFAVWVRIFTHLVEKE